MKRKWELYDLLLSLLGGDDLSFNICKALPSDTMNDILEYIATCHEVDCEDI